jgi:hypothetical protein
MEMDMNTEAILDYSTEPVIVRITMKTKRGFVYVTNPLTQTTYKVHKSRITYPDPRGQTQRVFDALKRGERVTPSNLYHV